MIPCHASQTTENTRNPACRTDYDSLPLNRIQNRIRCEECEAGEECEECEAGKHDLRYSGRSSLTRTPWIA